MILDSQEYLANAQAVTATGDTPSTNVLDTLVAQDEGLGESVYINALVTTTPTSAGAATVQAVLQGSPDNSSWTDIVAGPSLAYNAAGAAAGQFLLQAKIGPYAQTYRYLRVAWRVGTAVLTAGNFSAFITKDAGINKNYANGFTVA